MDLGEGLVCQSWAECQLRKGHGLQNVFGRRVWERDSPARVSLGTIFTGLDRYRTYSPACVVFVCCFESMLANTGLLWSKIPVVYRLWMSGTQAFLRLDRLGSLFSYFYLAGLVLVLWFYYHDLLSNLWPQTPKRFTKMIFFHFRSIDNSQLLWYKHYSYLTIQKIAIPTNTGANWIIIGSSFFSATQYNNVCSPKDEIAAPEGWEWTWTDWTVDLNRAVDEEGRGTVGIGVKVEWIG